MKDVGCFDFVPSNYENAWDLLSNLPKGVLCEWGSGLGIVVGLAEILGYNAFGVELDAGLVESSRSLLHKHHLSAQIHLASYYEDAFTADYYYVYCWPGQIETVQKRFLDVSPHHAKLLICDGQDKINVLGKSRV